MRTIKPTSRRATGTKVLLALLPLGLVLPAWGTSAGAAHTRAHHTRAHHAKKAKQLTQVNIAIPEPGADFVPELVAQQKGYYKKLGITTKLTTVKTPDQPPALLSGSVQFTTVNAFTIEAAWTQGAPIVSIMNLVINPPYQTVAKPGITNASQLAGKSIGTNGSSDFLCQLTSYYLQKLGGVPVGGATCVGLGPDPQRLVGLENGAVDAATFDPGFVPQAKAKGFKPLIQFSKVAKGTPISGLSTSTTYLKEHRPVVKSLVKGTLEAMQWIKSHPGPATKIYKNYLGQTAAEAKVTYKASVEAFNMKGTVTPNQIRKDLVISSAFKEAKTGAKIEIPNPFTKADMAKVSVNIKVHLPK